MLLAERPVVVESETNFTQLVLPWQLQLQLCVLESLDVWLLLKLKFKKIVNVFGRD